MGPTALLYRALNYADDGILSLEFQGKEQLDVAIDLQVPWVRIARLSSWTRQTRVSGYVCAMLRKGPQQTTSAYLRKC